MVSTPRAGPSSSPAPVRPTLQPSGSKMLALGQRSTHRTQEPRRSTFWQQRWRARHNPLHSRWRLLCYNAMLATLLFAFAGWLFTHPVLSTIVEYACYDGACVCNGLTHCNVSFEVPAPLAPPWMLLYRLDDFHQSHRRYQKGGLCAVKNRSACDLQLRTIFNDSLSLVAADGAVVGGADTEAVTWGADRWRGADSAAEVAWLRTSPFGTRKALARYNTSLPAGNYTMVIENAFPCDVFIGSKSFELARWDGSVGGGTHRSLAMAAAIVGALALALALGAATLIVVQPRFGVAPPILRRCRDLDGDIELLMGELSSARGSTGGGGGGGGFVSSVKRRLTHASRKSQKMATKRYSEMVTVASPSPSGRVEAGADAAVGAQPSGAADVGRKCSDTI